MSTEETDYSAIGRLVFIMGILGHVFSPFLFIWSVNTLFLCGIPFTFKTWLAGFALIMLTRYHLKTSVKTEESFYDDYEFDDGDNGDYEDGGKAEDSNSAPKGKVIAYSKDREKKPPDTR